MADTAPHLQVDVDRSADPVRVIAVGEVDAATAPMLSTAVDEVLTSGTAAIALDLGSVTFIDSSGLRAITIAERAAGEADRGFSVTVASEPVRKIFAMTGLGGLLAD